MYEKQSWISLLIPPLDSLLHMVVKKPAHPIFWRLIRHQQISFLLVN